MTDTTTAEIPRNIRFMAPPSVARDRAGKCTSPSPQPCGGLSLAFPGMSSRGRSWRRVSEKPSMRLRPTFVHALILSLSTGAAIPAQVTFKTTGYEIRDAFADVIHIWTSPAHSEKRDWVGVLGVTAGAVALL